MAGDGEHEADGRYGPEYCLYIDGRYLPDSGGLHVSVRCEQQFFYRRRSRPFTIGIAGDSGAGKSRLLVMLGELLSEDHILNIEGDGDHRWERGDANWKE